MLSRHQIIFLKRAQRDANLPDPDYRDALATVSGMPDCRSSKDPRLTDEHWDNLLKYFEAIFWKTVGTTSTSSQIRSSIFSSRNYWKNRNPRGHSSRAQFTEAQLTREILALENQLHALGFGLPYLRAIQNRIQPFSLTAYRAALQRTLKSKSRAQTKEPQPF